MEPQAAAESQILGAADDVMEAATAAIAQMISALPVVVQVFDEGPSRLQSHPRTTF